MDSKAETITRFLLTSDNYAIWTIPMEAKLEDIEALDIATGRVRDGAEDNEAAKALYKKLNRKAYSLIVQNLDSTNLALVSTTLPATDHFNGHAVWMLLKNKYAGSDLIARSVALDNFLDIEFTSITLFCSAMRLANQKMILAGIRLDDQVKMLIMLRKLPHQDYHSFRDIVAMGFLTESFEAIVKRLEAYTITNKVKKEESTIEGASMYSNQSKNNQESNNIVCSHCNRPGHPISNCWKKYPEKSPHIKKHQAHLTHTTDVKENEAFSFFTTPDGKRYNLNDVKFDNVKYYS